MANSRLGWETRRAGLPPGEYVSTRLRPEARRALVREAAKRDQSLAGYVRGVLNRHIEALFTGAGGEES